MYDQVISTFLRANNQKILYKKARYYHITATKNSLVINLKHIRLSGENVNIIIKNIEKFLSD